MLEICSIILIWKSLSPYYDWRFHQLEIQIHEVWIHNPFDDLLILAKQYFYRFLDLKFFSNTLSPQLLKQVFICNQHLWLVQQQNYLNQDVVDESKSYLLNIDTVNRINQNVKERVNFLHIWKSIRIIRAPIKNNYWFFRIFLSFNYLISIKIIHLSIIFAGVSRHLVEIYFMNRSRNELLILTQHKLSI